MALRRATFRLYPNKQVSEMLHYHRQLHKDLYNAAVSNRITSYKKFGKSVSYFEQQNCLPDFKEVWIEYKEINSQALQATLKRVDFAFGRFFKGLGKYPRFKSPRHYSGWTYPSFTGWKVHSTGDNGYLELSKIGQIQMRGKARLWGHPKALDIVYRNGKWYASLVLEIDDILLKNSRKTDNGVIAIDLGCNDAIAWTNGEENGLVAAPRFFRKAEQRNKQLGKAKRRKRAPNFKKKVKASRRWKKTQKLVSKLNRKVANQRQNFVHQETTRIISCNSTVVTEKLEVKKMSAKAKKGKRKKQKAGLNKSILDVGMGMIKSALKAKLSDIGGLFVEVPTRKVKPSQTCPKCGNQEKKSLAERTHVCHNCGYTQQRDIAAAEVMLLWYSNNLQGLGTSLSDVDDSSSTSNTSKRKNAGSMKQLGRAKRQKSQAPLGDVETPGSNEVSQG
ncbi:RNA-guided endonuclease InsQ/TnpB family protein [Dolichospermum flos-aquae]|uniref:Transposase n=1 Tax=Dolichospermum flos-aquae CCAP 1403/13F TaxID=315271 RepID=A0A6H2BWU2_DOLFA|nr:RNA-guided endonuclease TnpB family protein [Dolichospermum flos-aquae]QJB43561.1 transposase [Dolichospermum flos-aquae CCAP 1403/13F]